jgi:hypothetical protein
MEAPQQQQQQEEVEGRVRRRWPIQQLAGHAPRPQGVAQMLLLLLVLLLVVLVL